VGDTNGQIDYPGDVDWLSFNAVAGTTYDAHIADAGGYSPGAFAVIDPSGDDLSWVTRAHWTASADSTYFFRVGSDFVDTFILSVVAERPEDGNGAADAV